MSVLYQIYKCLECGNVVEVVHAGGGELVCCGHSMLLMKENSTDAVQEKHVPVIEIENSAVRVKVGSVAHPMEEAHSIEWIEMIMGEKSQRIYLRPGDAPEALFEKPVIDFSVRAYCNLHGLWKNN